MLIYPQSQTHIRNPSIHLTWQKSYHTSKQGSNPKHDSKHIIQASNIHYEQGINTL